MKKIKENRPRPEYLMINENASKRCKIHIWRRRSNPKVCRNCGRMKPLKPYQLPYQGVTGFDIDTV